ncbi:MAG: type I restriction enzyme HsdR N-terminal domain-containing protein [Prevotellaceae bacterium]|nr:type I restriction enzyme HsdR N-terminal domain-containing protein [Prevotellaceae bacterium]
MIELNLPSYAPRLRENGGRKEIFDPLREKFVALTPEEWVRQHFVNYLVAHKGYPASLLQNEVSLRSGRATRRCDTVLYAREGLRPRLIAEYKSPAVEISREVFRQIASYNSVLHADFLVVSNGISHFCLQMDYAGGRASCLREIPDYTQLP